MHHYVYMDNRNSGNTTNTVLGFRNAVIHRLGAAENSPRWFNQHGVQNGILLKTGPGRLQRVIANDLRSSSSGFALYDGITALNPIATFLTGANNQTPTTFQYSLDFYNGLYLVCPNVANQDFTFVYE